jgi:hypothetical protein
METNTIIQVTIWVWQELQRIPPPVVGALIGAIVVWLWNRRNHINSVMPVLVFTRKLADCWQVQNVGRGPALNLVVGDKNQSGELVMVIQMYPLASEASHELSWLRSGQSLEAKYTDINARPYWSECKNDQTTIGNGEKFGDWRVTHRQYDLEAQEEMRRKQRDWGVL